jgi:hypothetical protein
MVWTAILVTLAVSVTVFALRRCRQANSLIERILVEELGAPSPAAADRVVPMVPHQAPAGARLEMDQLLGVDRV